MKIPKNLAQVADLYYTARTARLDAEKAAKKLQEREKELRDYLIDNLPKSKIGGISGQLAQVEVVKKFVPIIEDRDTFFKYVKRTKQDDLVNQSLNATAIKDRWEANKEIPGIGRHVVVTLSLHKVTNKRK